jgi:glycosyltransferase involved in cell wall biosynthesis
MACGTPVIANSRGSMGELIAQRVTGFLVDDVDSAVAAVAAAGDLDRRRIAERAADRFTVATMIDKYVKVYRDVIADRK